MFGLSDPIFSSSLFISCCLHATFILGLPNASFKLLSNQTMPLPFQAPTIIYAGEEFPEIRTEQSGSESSMQESPAAADSENVEGVDDGQASGLASDKMGVYLPDKIEQKGEGKAATSKTAVASPAKSVSSAKTTGSAGKNAQSIPRRSNRTARVEEIDLSDILVFKVFTSYYQHLSVRIKGYMHYPPELVNERKKGSVYVSFVLHRSGNITDLKVVESSGDPRFDKAALQAIRMSAPFPGFPSEIVENRMTLFLPVTFSAD